MNFKSTIRATTSAYFGTITAAATGLISIRLATHFLAKEEFGLWSFTMQTVGYFMLMDLGVSNSVARLLGEPLGSGETQKINSWFTLSLLTLISQALLILGLGILLRPYVLQWFSIPSHLLGQASELWLAFLVIQAVALVFKISFAILHAQNRVYWTSNLQIVGSWLGLGSFYIMLINGWGVLAYAWSSAVAMLVVSLGGILAVRRGGLRFKLTLTGITRSEISTLFKFSSSMFVLGLASQVYLASQGLVATKMLGLEIAAVLAVTGRAATIAMSAIWKPLDAFAPRWQVAYCAGNVQRVTREFEFMARFTILLAVAAAVVVGLVNQPFVMWWTKPTYFGGLAFSLLLCVFLIIQGINRCFITPFILTLQVKSYCIVNLASVALAIGCMILFTKNLGLMGIPLGLIVADLVFPMWFYLRKGGDCIHVNGLKLLRKDLAYVLPTACAAAGLAIVLEGASIASNFTWILIAGTCAIVISFPLLWRAWGLLLQLRSCEYD